MRFLVVFLCLLALSLSTRNSFAQTKTVQVIYLVPKDCVPNETYKQRICQTVTAIQLWYAAQLNGKTFTISGEFPKVVMSQHDSQYFETTANRPNPDYYTFYNALDDVTELLGKKPDNVGWLIYVDAPGKTGAGFDGVAILPRHDLKALLAENKKDFNFPPVAGGHAHELGHLFGLPHAGDSEKNALMQFGYGKFPNCYLTQQDREKLSNNPYFQFRSMAEVYAYDGGGFIDFGGNWVELKADDGTVISFEYTSQDPDSIVLKDKDPNRQLWISLPKKGGKIYWKTPDHPEWVYIYDTKH